MSKWQEISVTTTEEAAEAVSNLFYEIGASGVVIQDPKVLARYLAEANWDAYELPVELIEAENVVIKGYLPIDDLLPGRLNQFRNQLETLQEHFTQYLAEVSLAEIAEEDWANSWKTYYKPEKIGNRIVIVPSWENYSADEEDLIVKLDPGMAFGTGNHPTTALCIKFLEKYLQPGASVIDVGTGSGVLSIVAAKLGAGKVVAVDADTLAVQVAQQNVLENKVEQQVETKYSDLLAGVEEQADFIVANIIADVIILLTPQAKSKLKKGGFFLVSGIILDRWPDVHEVLTKSGFQVIERRQENDWVTALAQKMR
ncbi:50S ribosomal protein L11 methyltransferase [Bacillota bacterium LX-D]|nr:50S ribosomal protein L11 methyltransferase [Bacillota bacterium LX-D]